MELRKENLYAAAGLFKECDTNEGKVFPHLTNNDIYYVLNLPNACLSLKTIHPTRR